MLLGVNDFLRKMRTLPVVVSVGLIATILLAVLVLLMVLGVVPVDRGSIELGFGLTVLSRF